MTDSQAPAAGARLKPTDRQAEVLAAVVRHMAAHCGQTPSVREIGDAMGIASPNGVVYHLRALHRKGLIELPAGVQARGIRVTGLADAVRAAVEAWANENGVEL